MSGGDKHSVCIVIKQRSHLPTWHYAYLWSIPGCHDYVIKSQFTFWLS